MCLLCLFIPSIVVVVILTKLLETVKKKRKKKKKKEGKKREKIELYPGFIIQLNAKIEISLMRAGTTTSTTSVE